MDPHCDPTAPRTGQRAPTASPAGQGGGSRVCTSCSWTGRRDTCLCARRASEQCTESWPPLHSAAQSCGGGGPTKRHCECPTVQPPQDSQGAKESICCPGTSHTGHTKRCSVCVGKQPSPLQTLPGWNLPEVTAGVHARDHQETTAPLSRALLLEAHCGGTPSLGPGPRPARTGGRKGKGPGGGGWLSHCGCQPPALPLSSPHSLLARQHPVSHVAWNL